MKIGTILIVLLFVGLIVFGIFIYFDYEKEVQTNELEYVQLAISSKDVETNQNKITEYVVALDFLSNIYKNGTTLKNGFIMDKVPINHTIFIYNKNLNEEINQTMYYTNVQQVSSYERVPLRIVLDLVKPGKIEIIPDKLLDNSGNINVTISSKGIYKNAKMCIHWSKSIISVNILTLVDIPKPENYKNMDKCYNLKSFEDGDNMEVSIDYKVFGELNGDFIKLVVFDNDEIINDWGNEVSYDIEVSHEIS